ncbi:hypothetical protein [Lacticaseibacillus camelliae]|uniref:DUF1659 domain-containing protein n=1 Tax=Lacticaseibacillus camelliae DSM 22697 = JCM 13995 TaxID=1423730 RepID=A0A0R2F0R8_9LACO|nr:hypothetical protein [Lacticaseibacillus camelliae]KRN21430.1 hypothetical protein FC75_GL002232 [Lacticaseibacillus camelliae DSM 22697 = JCM 13995]
MAKKVVRQRITLTYVQPDNPNYRSTRAFGNIRAEATDENLMKFAQLIGKINPDDELGSLQVVTTSEVVDEG